MNSAEQKYRRHLGKVHKITIGDDEFPMKPLGGEYLVKFFKLANQMSKLKQTTMDGNQKFETSDLLETFTDETVNDIIDLMTVCFKKADEDVPEDVIKQFVSENFWAILPTFVEVNGMKDSKNAKINDRIKNLNRIRNDNVNKAVPSESKETE